MRFVLVSGLALATSTTVAEAQRVCTSQDLSGVHAVSARVVRVDSTLLDFGVSKEALERLLVRELRIGGLEIVPERSGMPDVTLEARLLESVTPAHDYAFYIRIAFGRPSAESVD